MSPSAIEADGLAGLEQLRRMMAGELPPAAMAATLGFAPVEVEPGRAVFEGEPGEAHLNPMGSVHGGYAATILDSALGCAVHATLAAGESYATASLEVKYLRPITRETGRVTATAEVVHQGSRQATAEARLTDEHDRVLATGTTTCLILKPR